MFYPTRWCRLLVCGFQFRIVPTGLNLGWWWWWWWRGWIAGACGGAIWTIRKAGFAGTAARNTRLHACRILPRFSSLAEASNAKIGIGNKMNDAIWIAPHQAHIQRLPPLPRWIDRSHPRHGCDWRLPGAWGGDEEIFISTRRISNTHPPCLFVGLLVG